MTTKKTQVMLSLDVDKLVRDESQEWFTSNRKELENTIQRVTERVREELNAIWSEENTALRERVRSLEEETKRLRSVLSMVRSQVVEEVALTD